MGWGSVMCLKNACHLLVREGVDQLILAVVLAWRNFSLQLRDSAGLSFYRAPASPLSPPIRGVRAPEQQLICNSILQSLRISVKRIIPASTVNNYLLNDFVKNINEPYTSSEGGDHKKQDSVITVLFIVIGNLSYCATSTNVPG